MTEWQPIETAPKSGRQILLYSKYDIVKMFVASYHDGRFVACGLDGDACDGAGDWQSIYDPTHWMLLPEPPKEKSDD